MPETSLDSCALIVVDLQQGFDDPAWGRRNDTGCESRIAELTDAWAAAGRPLVYVQHDSVEPTSPLAPGGTGNRLSELLRPQPDVLIRKRVNSAFHGSPLLDDWLRARQISEIAICGATTNHCCETTARVGANLGYEVLFALDATFTFDRRGPDGQLISADELARVTATNLHDEFASIVSTTALLESRAVGAT